MLDEVVLRRGHGLILFGMGVWDGCGFAVEVLLSGVQHRH